jgi:hypothetical protein
MIDVEKTKLAMALKPYFMDMIKTHPEYGSCGFTVKFHEGKPVKVTIMTGTSLKPDGISERAR